MSSPVIILGAGGHAAVVLELLRRLGAQVAGFVDSDVSLHGREVRGIAVLGGDEALFKGFPPHQVQLANGVGGAASTAARRAVSERYASRGYRFVTLAHPAAVIANDVVLGEGAQVMAGAVLQAAAQVGAGTIVNTGASVDHDCRIGSHVHVAPGAVLSGGVNVGDGAHLGTGCVVIQGVRIGQGATIAAGAVVLRDVPALARFAGNPAKEMQ